MFCKCLTILGIVTITAFCDNATTTVATVETTERNLSRTATRTIRLVEKKTIPTNVTSNNTDTVTDILTDDVTDAVTDTLTDTAITGNISNVTKHFVLQGKRKAVIIINHQPTSALRNRGRGKKKKSRGSSARKAKVESLLYEEYDADGTKLVEFMMYNMEDVSKFFAAYLHTELCHVRCEPRPEDIAREEAKKAAENAG